MAYGRAGKRQATRTLAKRAAAIMSKSANTQRMSKVMAARAAPYISRRYSRVVRDRLGENKYFDTSPFAFTNMGSDSTAAQLVTDLVIVPQGNTVQTRIGKKLRVLRVQIKGTIDATQTLATAANTGTLCRNTIVWDREPDKAAAVPVTTDIYMANTPTALSNRDNAPRFKILREYCYAMAPYPTAAAQATGAPGTPNIIMQNEYIDLTKKDLEVIWTKADTTGATANKVKGNLLSVWTFDNTKAAGAIYLTQNFRVDYEDEASKQRK